MLSFFFCSGDSFPPPLGPIIVTSVSFPPPREEKNALFLTGFFNLQIHQIVPSHSKRSLLSLDPAPGRGAPFLLSLGRNLKSLQVLLLTS